MKSHINDQCIVRMKDLKKMIANLSDVHDLKGDIWAIQSREPTDQDRVSFV